MKKKFGERPFMPFKILHMTKEDTNLITGFHHHTAIEMSCVISGKGKLEAGHNIYDFAVGDVFMFPPGERHGICECTSDTDILVVQFEPYYIWASDSDFSHTKLLDTFLNRSDKFKSKLSVEKAKRVGALLIECEEELINLDKEYLAAIKTIIMRILIYLLRSTNYASQSRVALSRAYNLESLRNSMEYIDSNLELDLDLDALAEAANMSRSYFCTIFKRYNGIKPWDYITIKRIDKSISMLAYSSEKKFNIALDCGFNNTANFYRAFKKITGKTPGDYEF